jgi:hypothetical protein
MRAATDKLTRTYPVAVPGPARNMRDLQQLRPKRFDRTLL